MCLKVGLAHFLYRCCSEVPQKTWGKWLTCTFICARTEEQGWKSFWWHLYSLRIQVWNSEFNCFTGIKTVLMEYFKRTAANCCLETWSIAAVLAWLHGTTLVPEVCQTQYFWSDQARLLPYLSYHYKVLKIINNSYLFHIINILMLCYQHSL